MADVYISRTGDRTDFYNPSFFLEKNKKDEGTARSINFGTSKSSSKDNALLVYMVEYYPHSFINV